MHEKAFDVDFFAKWDWRTVISNHFQYRLVACDCDPLFSIFANVLATHLEKVLSRLICFDYADFYQDTFPACHFQLGQKKEELNVISSSNSLGKKPVIITAAGRCSYMMFAL